MNIIVNLTKIKTKKNFDLYQMKIHDQTLLSRIINQVVVDSNSSIFLLVNDNLYAEFVEFAKTIEQSIIIKSIKTEDELIFCENLYLDDIVRAYKTFQTSDLYALLGPSFNQNGSSIIVEGSKLYKKNVFNFADTKNLTYIKFSDGNDLNSNIMLYISNNEESNNDVKKIDIKDYKYNFIDMTKLDTIIQSTEVFSESKKLRYEYLNQLFSEFKFEEALDLVKQFSTKNIYWAFMYLELLIGYGCEQEFIEFYQENKKYLREFNFTSSQRIIYKPVIEIFSLIDQEIGLINRDIKQYIEVQNTDFEFIIKSVFTSNCKTLSFPYLLRGLIEKNNLTEQQAIIFLNKMNLLQINPFIKKKMVCDISDYFLASELDVQISHKLINVLFVYLIENEELFEAGLKEKISIYTKNIQVTPKKSIDNKFEQQNNSNNNKVAICISGRAKYNYSKNLELIKNFTADYLDADYFVQLWNDQEVYQGLSEFGTTPDFEWATNYLNHLNRIQPAFIKRQANFEALFPNTAHKLFAKQVEETNEAEYIELFGDKLKGIKKINYKAFLEKLKYTNAEYFPLHQKLISYFERDAVMNLVTKYAEESGESYSYVINIDIDTVLKSPIYLDELQQIENNQVYAYSEDSDLNFSYTLARYNEAQKINSLWQQCQLAKSPSPYNVSKFINDTVSQNPMLYHLLYQNIEIKLATNSFGGPSKNKKIVLPSIEEEFKQDLENYQGDTSALVKYFNEVERLFSNEFPNNQRYKHIHSVKLIQAQIVNTGIILEFSIKGNNLKQINSKNLYLYGMSKFNIDTTHTKSQIFKHNFEVLKLDDDEIVVKRHISKIEIQTGNAWNFMLMYHDYTITHFKIEFDQRNLLRELDRYGLLYIKRDDEFEIGIASKSMLLNEF